MYEITIETVFAASHALHLPGGRDEPLHGHNWPVAVTVAASELDEIEAVMDFHDLEAIVADLIAPMHNHHLNDVGPFADGRVNPSAERVAWWIGERVAERLPKRVHLVAVRVGEAPGCAATWRP
ncbi:MAG: 6-carboxytetrahydropterin synthase [Phycisphaeraceae bacterium]